MDNPPPKKEFIYAFEILSRYKTIKTIVQEYFFISSMAQNNVRITDLPERAAILYVIMFFHCR